MLARETDDGLAYAGTAFVTLGGSARDRFWTEIERLRRPKPVIAIERKKSRRRVDPTMRVKVQSLKGASKLRHATVRELI